MDRESFLRELTELTKKHKIVIGGCGCCGSPFILELEPANEGGHYELGGQGDRSTDSDDDLKWKP